MTDYEHGDLYDNAERHRLWDRLRADARAQAARDEEPRRPRRRGKPAPTFTPRLTSNGTGCARIDRYGSDCDEPGEVALTAVCRICGPVNANVCLDCFDEVVYDLAEDGEGLLCTSETPGKHQFIHLTEAVFSVERNA